MGDILLMFIDAGFNSARHSGSERISIFTVHFGRIWFAEDAVSD